MLSLEDFFNSLNAELSPYREAKRRADRQQAPDFNVFSHIRPDENRLSDILADLLDPRGSHGQGSLFLILFLQAAGLPLEQPLDSARLRRENLTDFLQQNRRIDFTVEAGPIGVGVENKPWADDQPDQVVDYVRHLKAKYGEDRYFLVYLSGDGSPPSSISAGERGRLERQGSFSLLSYSSGLRDWLNACREACQAEKVRHFLADFESYVEANFGGRGMQRIDAETEIVVRHALKNEDNLALVLGVAKAFNGVATAVISEFTKALTERVTQDLAAHGGGWRLRDDLESEKAVHWGEKLAISREGWSSGDGLTESLRVVLAYDQSMPCKVYFSARRVPQLPNDLLAGRIAEALNARCGHGKRDGAWWPYWYRYEDTLTAWADPDVLLQLARKQDVLDHFAGRLVRMAVAVDSALRTPAP
jgi:hypothetical protein